MHISSKFFKKTFHKIISRPAPGLGLGYKFHLNILQTISSFFLKSYGENKLVNCNSVLRANIKSINAKQKYPHIIESYACNLNTLLIVSLFPINCLISLGICSTPNFNCF